MTATYSILSRIQQAMMFFFRSLEPPVSALQLLGRNFTRQVPFFRLIPLSLACGSGLLGPILKEPQCGNSGKQIESSLNCENPLV